MSLPTEEQKKALMGEARRSISTPPDNKPYIMAVIAMMFLGVIGIIAITMIRPEQDNTILIAAMLGFLAPTTLALLAFMKSQETHLSVNSRLDAFMHAAESAARYKGIEEGRVKGQEETAATAVAAAVAADSEVLKTQIVETQIVKKQENP